MALKQLDFEALLGRMAPPVPEAERLERDPKERALNQARRDEARLVRASQAQLVALGVWEAEQERLPLPGPGLAKTKLPTAAERKKSA